jgi:hypothetical protein
MMGYHTLSWKENFKQYKDPYQYMMLKKPLQIITFELKIVMPRTFIGYVNDILLIIAICSRIHLGLRFLKVWFKNSDFKMYNLKT